LVKRKEKTMNKIIIDPHYCSREEYEELKKYLKNNCWDFRESKMKVEIKK